MSFDPTELALNITNSTAMVINVEINYIFATLSAISFLLLTVILFVYARGDDYFLGVPGSIGILFFCCLVTLVAELSMSMGMLFNIYVLVVTIGFGILNYILGSIYFFETPRRGERSLGPNHSSTSVIISGITIPLALMEMLLSIGALVKGKKLIAMVVLASLFQKVIQAGIYHFSLCHKRPWEDRYYGASWYFKIIALYNFTMWLQSLVDGNHTMHMYLTTFLKDNASVVSSVYAALIIDYRLLCLLLYIELAVEVDNWNQHLNNDQHERRHTATPLWNKINFRVIAKQYTGCGYIFGLILVILQFINALQYAKIVPPWSNIFGILADLLVICQGVALIKLVNYYFLTENKFLLYKYACLYY